MTDEHPMLHQWHETVELIQRALAEDAAMADATSLVLPRDLTGEAALESGDTGVLAGLEVAFRVFQEVDHTLECQAVLPDGARVEPRQCLGTVKGRLSSILRAERTALNFVQRLSGVATATRAFVDAVAGLPATIVDTRKTPPGWRLLDKYAVRVGGGRNHRMNLADGVLIKDNHIAAMASRGVGITELVRQARARSPHTVRIEVEAETLEQVQQALEGGGDIVMLDNMDPETMRQAVDMCRGKALTEASGGITLETVRQVAETGVDLISTGSITHSVHAMDISLSVVPGAPTP